MKPTLRDYLAIVAALLAIFLCGYGIGFLFGERKALSRSAKPMPQSSAGWERDTLATLEQSIELSPEQIQAIESEIAISGDQVRATREHALQAYRTELSALHQRLKAHLTPEQWQKLQNPTPAND